MLGLGALVLEQLVVGLVFEGALGLRSRHRKQLVCGGCCMVGVLLVLRLMGMGALLEGPLGVPLEGPLGVLLGRLLGDLFHSKEPKVWQKLWPRKILRK